MVLNLYGTRDPFQGRQFYGLEWGMVSGRFKLITFTAHFISIIITLVPPQIILEDGDCWVKVRMELSFVLNL